MVFGENRCEMDRRNRRREKIKLKELGGSKRRLDTLGEKITGMKIRRRKRTQDTQREGRAVGEGESKNRRGKEDCRKYVS